MKYPIGVQDFGSLRMDGFVYVAKPFALDGRKIIKIGANFSSETRHLTGWKIV